MESSCLRNAEETLSLLKKVLIHRREYVRKKLEEAHTVPRPNKGRQKAGVESKQIMRGGMLSELTTIECVLKMIEKGDNDPLTWWVEPLTTELTYEAVE